jgi:hypothetical protein
MIETRQLLDAAKRAQGITSDYRLARTMGVTDSTLHNYRAGKTHPDEAQSLQLAAMAGLDAGYVLVSMAAARAKTEAARAHFARVAAMLRALPPGGNSGASGGGGGGILSGSNADPSSPHNPDGMGLVSRLASVAQGFTPYTSSQIGMPDALMTSASLAALPVVAIVERRRRLSARAA